MTTTIDQRDIEGRKPRQGQTSLGRSKKDSGAKIATLQAQLRDKEELVQAKDAALRELEARLGAQIHSLENRVWEKEELLVGCEAQLKALESRMSVFVEEMKRSDRDRERMSGEIEKLTSELKQKKLSFAKTEIEEWRSIGRQNWWKRKLGSLGKFFTKAWDNK